MPLFLHIAFAFAIVEGLQHGQAAVSSSKRAGGAADDAFTFDEFVRAFGRTYGEVEHARRARIFEDSLVRIHAVNSRSNRSWIAGVHPFMDWTDFERSARLHGYDAFSSSRASASTSPFVGLQASLRASAVAADAADGGRRVYGDGDDAFEAAAPPVRDQNQFGHCASCWAFAAVEALEARLTRQRVPAVQQPRLSVQALLDCMPRQESCRGGCQGATPELAFDFIRDVGIPLEANLPYSPHAAGVCSLEPYPLDWVRVRLSGWRTLPRNQAQSLMRALVEDGPAVVTADAHEWYPYKSGVFDSCPRDATPNHSLLARGYGVDARRKYWLLQNSWGSRWGEHGAIRLLRHDDEHSWCGTDSRTQEGVECNNHEHRNVTVCGMCGLLYDPIAPLAAVVATPGSEGAERAEAGAETELIGDVEAADAGMDEVQDAEAQDDSDGIADVDPLFARARRLRPRNRTLSDDVSEGGGTLAELAEVDADEDAAINGLAADSGTADVQEAELRDAGAEGAAEPGGAEGSADDFGADFDPELVEAFHAFDLDSSGFVSAGELRHVMGIAGAQLSMEEADRMISDADQDGDDKVDYEEFAKMMVAE